MALPRQTVYRVPRVGPHLSALGDAGVAGRTEHQNHNTRNRSRGKVFMVSPAGFEPATPGLEEQHSGVYGVAPMRCSPCAATKSAFLSIYAVSPKTPIAWLRGDGWT